MSQWALYLSGGTPFGAVRHQRGKSHRRWLIQQEGKRRNDSAVKIVLTFPAAPPFGGCATTFPPQAVGQQSSVRQLSQKWQEL